MKSTIAHLWLLAALPLLAPLPARADAVDRSNVHSIQLSATGEPAVVAGRAVQFYDTSTGFPASWEWDFSYEPGVATVDSREQNPLWTFADPGTWDVRLESCNVFGCAGSVKQIEVVPPCSLIADRVLGPLLVIVTSETYEACRTITVEAGFSLLAPGDVTFHAGRSVAFGDGFSVGSGARLRVWIDPLLDIP